MCNLLYVKYNSKYYKTNKRKKCCLCYMGSDVRRKVREETGQEVALFLYKPLLIFFNHAKLLSQ